MFSRPILKVYLVVLLSSLVFSCATSIQKRTVVSDTRIWRGMEFRVTIVRPDSFGLHYRLKLEVNNEVVIDEKRVWGREKLSTQHNGLDYIVSFDYGGGDVVMGRGSWWRVKIHVDGEEAVDFHEPF